MQQPENGSQQNIEELETVDAPLSKLIFLGIVTLALCGFPPFFVLAPVPLTMGLLLYGRAKGIGLGILVTGILFYLGKVNPESFSLGGMVSVMTLIYSLILSETIRGKVEPIKGFIYAGFSLVGILLFFWLVSSVFSDFSVKNIVNENVMTMVEQFKTGKNAEILKSGNGEEVRAIQDLITNPQELVDKIVSWLPSGIFVGIFLSLWISFFLILRNWPLWKAKIDYPFTLKDFMDFKVPFLFVYPVIAALTLTLFGNYIGSWAEDLGPNVLYCLGIFYFFHGFGVFLEFLTHLGILGFMRSVLIAFTFVLAWRLVAIVGLFDVWINFRKFFVKNKNNQNDDNEGDDL